MARKITLAVLQSALTDDADKNIKRISDLVREAASKGANVILPSELFEGHYFCTSQEEGNFARAYPGAKVPP
jgi:N-carbamoylputrescine amidase